MPGGCKGGIPSTTLTFRKTGRRGWGKVRSAGYGTDPSREEAVKKSGGSVWAYLRKDRKKTLEDKVGFCRSVMSKLDGCRGRRQERQGQRQSQRGKRPGILTGTVFTAKRGGDGGGHIKKEQLDISSHLVPSSITTPSVPAPVLTPCHCAVRRLWSSNLNALLLTLQE